MGASESEDIAQVVTTPLSDVTTAPTQPLFLLIADPAPHDTIPAPGDVAAETTQPLLDPAIAHIPTLRLIFARRPSGALTRPLTRLALVYRAVTYPLVQATQSRAIIRRTLRLTRRPSIVMRAAQRAQQRRRLTWLALAFIALGALLLAYAFWRYHA